MLVQEKSLVLWWLPCPYEGNKSNIYLTNQTWITIMAEEGTTGPSRKLRLLFWSFDFKSSLYPQALEVPDSPEDLTLHGTEEFFYIVEFCYTGKYFKYFCVLNTKTPLLFCHYWIIADNKGAFSGHYRFHNTHQAVQNTHPTRAILIAWIITCFSAIIKSVIIYHVKHRNMTAIDEAERIALKVWCKQNGAAP